MFSFKWMPPTVPPEKQDQLLLLVCGMILAGNYRQRLETYFGYPSSSATVFAKKDGYISKESNLPLVGWMYASTLVNLSIGYDPAFGDDKLCVCGHTYYRHFDPYEDMEPVGCKYCMPSDKYNNIKNVKHPDNFMEMSDEERDKYIGQCAGFKLAEVQP